MDRHWAPPPGPAGTAVLLHGLSSTAATWWQVGPMLAERGWDTWALDLAGHGDAAPPDQPLDLGALAGDVAARLPRRADLLIGHSLGAATATALAAARPELVGALVLEDPPGGPDIGGPELADNLVADTTLALADREAVARRERGANPTWAPEDVAHSVDGIARLDLAWVAGGLRGGLRADLPALLADVGERVPVLLIVAPDRLGTMPGNSASALRGQARAGVEALVPPERFVVLDGGHCLHRDHPKAWVAAVTDFAGGLWTPVDT